MLEVRGGWQASGLKGRMEALEETTDWVRGRDEVRLLVAEGYPPSEVVGVDGGSTIVLRLRKELA